MKYPLIVGLGAVTSVGLTAPQTCAAIRAGISGFSDAVWTAPPPAKPQIGAVVPARSSLKVSHSIWLANMASRAIRECIKDESPISGDTALLVSVPEIFRNHPATTKVEDQSFINILEQRLKLRFHSTSKVFLEGASDFFRSISFAKGLLAQGIVKHCIVGGVDSLINGTDIMRFNRVNRLSGSENSQGLIPGEGAVFILLTLPSHSLKSPPLAQILGAGVAMEMDTVRGDRYSVGKGLRKALENAISDANLQESNIDFLVSDMNGERYQAWESTMCHTRFYRTRRERLHIWYPAASVGDIGVASGALLILISAMGIVRGYAPGRIAMCEGSSEEGLRAACLIGPSSQATP